MLLYVAVPTAINTVIVWSAVGQPDEAVVPYNIPHDQERIVGLVALFAHGIRWRHARQR
jgi:hypothetical protein